MGTGTHSQTKYSASRFNPQISTMDTTNLPTLHARDLARLVKNLENLVQERYNVKCAVSLLIWYPPLEQIPKEEYSCACFRSAGPKFDVFSTGEGTGGVRIYAKPSL